MNFKRSTAVKVTAFLLCILTFITGMLASAATFVLAEFGFYTRSFEAVREKYLGHVLTEHATDAGYTYIYEKDALEQLTEYRNFLFEIRDSVSGDILFPFGEGEKGDVSAELTLGEKYLDTSYRLKITVYNTKHYLYTDEISIADYWLNAGNVWRYGVIAVAALSFLLNITIFIILLVIAGYGKREEGPYLRTLDRIPYDIALFIFGSLTYLGIYVAADFTYGVEETVISVSAVTLFLYPMLLLFLMSTAARIKTGGIIKKTFVYNFVKFLLKLLKALVKGIYGFFSNVPLIWKTGLFILTAVLSNFLGTVFLFENSEFFGIVLWAGSWVAVIAAAYRIAIEFKYIKRGGEALSNGDYEKKIDTSKMMRDFKRHGDDLNRIGGSMSLALKEKLKSEHFKTELITNVSHDLKTPLTSIINYVDLIKKEKLDNENVKEYVEVLDRQSHKLKKLTEDLVEASKASTGNIAVDLKDCDLGELLNQVLAEYTDKLLDREVRTVVDIPDTPVIVSADGRHLWRIFDNLMSNILKYTMSGTRVYIDIERKEGTAEICFRNISSYPLRKSGEELTERFARDDESRHSEGSGLGLSIAKSLTELQKGRFSVSTDGDLFKAVLSFTEKYSS